jgi:hypothetical protein
MLSILRSIDVGTRLKGMFGMVVDRFGMAEDSFEMVEDNFEMAEEGSFGVVEDSFDEKGKLAVADPPLPAAGTYCYSPEVASLQTPV